MFRNLLKESIIVLKMFFIIIKYQRITIKRYKVVLEMKDMHENYSNCWFLMPVTNELYRDMFDILCKVKGEMSSGQEDS